MLEQVDQICVIDLPSAVPDIGYLAEDGCAPTKISHQGNLVIHFDQTGHGIISVCTVRFRLKAAVHEWQKSAIGGPSKVATEEGPTHLDLFNLIVIINSMIPFAVREPIFS